MTQEKDDDDDDDDDDKDTRVIGVPQLVRRNTEHKPSKTNPDYPAFVQYKEKKKYSAKEKKIKKKERKKEKK